MKKLIFFFVFVLCTKLSFAQQADTYSGGIYWTLEDYQNGKLDRKGKLVGALKAFGLTAAFENEAGVKERIVVTKAFAILDERGILWRPDTKHSVFLMTIIKGSACLYIDGELVGTKDDFKEIRCGKKGNPLFNGNVFYVSKGFEGEITYGPKEIREILADDQNALDILGTNARIISFVYQSFLSYNKNKPLKGDYVYPECEKQ